MRGLNVAPVLTPHKILARRMVKRQNKPAVQFLVQWVDHPEEVATWVFDDVFEAKYPTFFPVASPWGQGSHGGSFDTAQLDCSHLFCLLPPFCFYCFPPFTVLLLCSPPFTVLLLDPVSYFCYEWLSWQCELAGCCRKNRKRHDDIYGKGKWEWQLNFWSLSTTPFSSLNLSDSCWIQTLSKLSFLLVE